MPQVTKLMSVRTISTAPVPTSSEQTLNFGRSRKCADYFLNCKSRRTSLNCIGDKCFRIIHFFFQMKSGHWVTLCDRLKPTSSDCNCKWHWSAGSQVYLPVYSMPDRKQTFMHVSLFIFIFDRWSVSKRNFVVRGIRPSARFMYIHPSIPVYSQLTVARNIWRNSLRGPKARVTPRNAYMASLGTPD